MKIAMIGHKRIPSREGGIEIVVEALSTRLVKLSNTVVAYNRSGAHVSGKQFSSEKEKQNEYKGVKLVTVPTPKSKALNAVVYSFFATVKALFGGYDVIHYHAEGPAAMCFIPKMFGIRTVVTIHGLDWKRSKWGGFATKYLKFGEKTAAKYADEIIVLSKAVQKYFLDTYNRETHYIPNGIEKPEIKGDEEIQKKYFLKKNGYILYLGRIVPEKGIHYLIDAYSEIDTDMPLVIAGGSSHSEEYFSQLKKQAEGKNIIFTDFVQGEILEELYSGAYIYVLPSDLEGMPISLMEAMSYSNCCLVSDIDECTELCSENAVYFKKGDINDLKNKLSYLLKNKDVVNRLKRNAADYIVSGYNWDDITEKTLRLYKGELN